MKSHEKTNHDPATMVKNNVREAYQIRLCGQIFNTKPLLKSHEETNHDPVTVEINVKNVTSSSNVYAALEHTDKFMTAQVLIQFQ